MLRNCALRVELRKCGIYREEAVDAISGASEEGLTDKAAREMSSRALLILGGRFFAYGEPLTEGWILKQAGFYKNTESNVKEDLVLDNCVLQVCLILMFYSAHSHSLVCI